MSRYRLFADKNTYAMTTHLLLEELNIDHELIWFDLHDRANYPDEFTKLNPNLKVPLLITPKGPVYESAATLMVLSEQHNNRFMPQPNSPKRAAALQWLFFLLSSFQPEVMILFHPERYYPNSNEKQAELKISAFRELENIWKIIDEAVSTGPYFLGDDYTLCDMMFLMPALWKENQPENIANYPNILNLMQKAIERPSVQKIVDIHGIRDLAESIQAISIKQ
jgi:glutathione S-transferase